MAIISMTFDTKSKECKVNIDGTEVTDVVYLSMSKYDDCGGINIETESKKVDGMRVYNRVCASKQHSGSQSEKQIQSLGQDKEFLLVQVSKSEVFKGMTTFRKPNKI